MKTYVLALIGLLTFVASSLAAPVTRPTMDFDGDNRDDLTVYASETGDWYINRSGNNQLLRFVLGGMEVQPVIGDFDGEPRRSGDLPPAGWSLDHRPFLRQPDSDLHAGQCEWPSRSGRLRRRRQD